MRRDRWMSSNPARGLARTLVMPLAILLPLSGCARSPGRAYYAEVSAR